MVLCVILKIQCCFYLLEATSYHESLLVNTVFGAKPFQHKQQHPSNLYYMDEKIGIELIETLLQIDGETGTAWKVYSYCLILQIIITTYSASPPIQQLEVFGH